MKNFVLIVLMFVLVSGTPTLASPSFFGSDQPEMLDLEFDPALECAWYEWNQATRESVDAMLADERTEYHEARLTEAGLALQMFPNELVVAINKRSNWRVLLNLPNVPPCAAAMS